MQQTKGRYMFVSLSHSRLSSRICSTLSALAYSDERCTIQRTMFSFHDPGKLVDKELQLILTQKYAGDESKGFVPSYRFNMALIGKNNDIGNIELRIGNTEYILLYAGHIGYRVHPGY